MECKQFSNDIMTPCNDYTDASMCNTNTDCYWANLTAANAGIDYNCIGKNDIGLPKYNSSITICNSANGYAYWGTKNHGSKTEWDISQCSCPNDGGTTFGWQENNLCYITSTSNGNGVYYHISGNDYIMVHNLWENIIYNDSESEQGSTYTCSKCGPEEGSSDSYSYTPVFNEAGPEISGYTCQASPGHACKCERVPKGYYRNNGSIWGSQYGVTEGTSDGTKTPCPASKTTTGDGAGADAISCIYTAQSKFCDTGGCFTLGALKNNYGIEYETSDQQPTWTDWPQTP